jgi:hypothetical protein
MRRGTRGADEACSMWGHAIGAGGEERSRAEALRCRVLRGLGPGKASQSHNRSH